MLTIDRDLLTDSIPVATAWLLADCSEYRGKQDLWSKQKPEVLTALRRRAMVESVESSNRIEGVTVDADRLVPLVLEKSKPRDRSEEEIAGYRRALEWVFGRKPGLKLEPDTMRELHRLSQGFGDGAAYDAGEWKARDNEIIETVPGEGRRVRFVPTPAKETPAAMARLCDRYGELIQTPSGPTLMVIATTILDFLCIHPFRDGNGRVSRLLTTYLLEQHGFSVGRYISLERLVEQSKEDYYAALGRCSQGWAEGRNEISPWWNYLLAVVRRGYAELESRVESASNREAVTDLIREAILRQIGPFTLADIRGQASGASDATIKRALSELRDAGNLRLSGSGRGAVWHVIKRRR